MKIWDWLKNIMRHSDKEAFLRGYKVGYDIGYEKGLRVGRKWQQEDVKSMIRPYAPSDEELAEMEDEWKTYW